MKSKISEQPGFDKLAKGAGLKIPSRRSSRVRIPYPAFLVSVLAIYLWQIFVTGDSILFQCRFKDKARAIKMRLNVNWVRLAGREDFKLALKPFFCRWLTETCKIKIGGAMAWVETPQSMCAKMQ
jgi:hypothetical protein